MKQTKPYRVLSIDGGGMRGYFNALYLANLEKISQRKFGVENLQIGSKFDMLVGTSSGAMIACGLANRNTLKEIITIFEKHGCEIFPKKISLDILFFWQLIMGRKRINKNGEAALRLALTEIFNNSTFFDIYDKYKVALVIPSINTTNHQGHIFKTPHNQGTNKRDDALTLVDASMASSAAPIYRSLAKINDSLHVDGGLFANNPILVALSEALTVTKDSSQKLEIYSLGLSPAVGSAPNINNPHWGFKNWWFGAKAVELSLDAQSGVFDYLGRNFANHIERDISIIRFQTPAISSEQSKLLALDDSSKQSLSLMRSLASVSMDDLNKKLILNDEESLKIQSILTNN